MSDNEQSVHELIRNLTIDECVRAAFVARLETGKCMSPASNAQELAHERVIGATKVIESLQALYKKEKKWNSVKK